MSESKIRRIEFANSTVEIEYQGEVAEHVIAFLFDHLPESRVVQPGMKVDSDKANISYRLIHDQGERLLLLYQDETLERFSPSQAEMALHLMERVSYQLSFHSKDGLVLHAGLVGLDGHGILLPGISGKGKTVLTAWLLTREFDYLTDELVFIPFGTMLGVGFCRPLNLKSDARRLIGKGLPVTDRKWIMRTRGVDMIRPEIMGAKRLLSDVSVELIVFPQYLASSELNIDPLSKAQAGLELMQCLINARNLPELGFNQVAELVRKIPAFKLVYGDLEQLEGVVERLFKYVN